MKEVNYDYTKSNVNLVSTQNSYADKINKIKYNIEINKLYAGNLKPKNKMNIIAEKPETKILSSSLNFKPLGFIFIAIIILSALSFFLLFFLKRPEDKNDSLIEAVILGSGKGGISKIINNQMNKIKDYEIVEEGKYLRFLDENEFNKFNKTDGILYNTTKEIIKIKLYFDSPLTNLDRLFEDCKDIIYIDLSHIQSPSINSMSQTFKGCEKLQKIDLTSVNTSKVTSMGSLFEGCTNLLDIKGIEDFDTSSLNNISRMFYNCTELILANLSAFNIDKIHNLNETFDNSSLNLRYIDLTNSSKVSSIINILSQINNNLTVFINEEMYHNHSKNLSNHMNNIAFKYNISYLECDKGNGSKCNSCKAPPSLECEKCNVGYNLSYYLSNMRCWEIEEEEEKRNEDEYEEINNEEEKEKEKENEKNNTNIDNDEEGKEKEKEKEKVIDEEEEDDKKLINDKENENENEKDEEDEKIKENEEEEKDEEINEIYKEEKKEKI